MVGFCRCKGMVELDSEVASKTKSKETQRELIRITGKKAGKSRYTEATVNASRGTVILQL